MARSVPHGQSPRTKVGRLVWSSPSRSAPPLRLRERRGGLIPGLHLHVQDHPQIRDEIAVIGVRGPPWLVRVVSDLGLFLMPIQRFHRRIQIECPRLFQQRLIAGFQMLLQPLLAFRLGHRCHRTSYRVLACHFAQAQPFGIDPIAPNRVDVRIAPNARPAPITESCPARPASAERSDSDRPGGSPAPSSPTGRWS